MGKRGEGVKRDEFLGYLCPVMTSLEHFKDL